MKNNGNLQKEERQAAMKMIPRQQVTKKRWRMIFKTRHRIKNQAKDKCQKYNSFFGNFHKICDFI